MNETLQSLKKRRSIRKYKPDQIRDDELNAILEAGMYAPSAANQQSATMVVVQQPALRAKLTKMNAAVIGKEMDPYYGATTIILVFGDKTKAAPIEDASLVLGNLGIAAHALGIGSCWIHREKQMFETEEGKALMKEWGLSEDCFGVGSIILGYPDCEEPKAPPRKEGYVILAK